MTKLMVKCTRQVPTRHIFVRTISNFAKQISNVDIIDFCKNKWKSGSDCHCDVIFYWKITKLVVKCTRQVQTRHIFVGTTSNFAKQISNVDIIDFCKKNDENRILTVTVTSLLIIIFDPKWQGSWWNTLGKSKCGIHF